MNTSLGRASTNWFGRVPQSWNSRKLKYLVELVDEKGPITDQLLRVENENIQSWTGKYITGVSEFAEKEEFKLFRARDVLFNKLRPYLAKVYHPELDGYSGGELLVFRATPTLDPRFLFYLAISKQFIEIVNGSTEGAKMPRADWDFIGQLPIAFPSRDCQQRIARFLDEKTAKIDQLIEKKRKLIELLREERQAVINQAVTKGLDPKVKLKPSGIEWLGNVPEHWGCTPLYTRYSIQLGKMLDEARISGKHLMPYLRNTDVQWNRINYVGLPQMDIAPEEMERYTIRCGDLLVCEGGEVGRAAMVGEVEGMFAYQKALHRLRAASKEEQPKYLFYVFVALSHKGVFVADGNPNTISHLTGEKLRRYRMPAPPIGEQNEIALFLDSKSSELDMLVSKAERGIELLSEYRTSLITEAVTGKLSVSEKFTRIADL
jgi:type I restriction enzyme, S subunit